MEKERDDETAAQTLDRNWGELLQELRVVQTGVQLLTGFLLTLPFQQRFASLSSGDRRLYLATVVASAVATLLLIAPVPLHRVLFRQHEREQLVSVAHVCAMLGSVALALAITGVNALVFGVVAGSSAGATAAALVAGAAGSLWVVGPLLLRWTCRRQD